MSDTERPEADKGGEWRCAGCADYVPADKVEAYGDGYCHVVAVADEDGEPEPSPCGPVYQLRTPTPAPQGEPDAQGEGELIRAIWDKHVIKKDPHVHFEIPIPSYIRRSVFF